MLLICIARGVWRKEKSCICDSHAAMMRNEVVDTTRLLNCSH